MKFEEALEIKSKYDVTFQITERFSGKVIVVPLNESDLNNYLTDFRVSRFNDNSAKKYSTNSEFQVCSVWTDGVNVMKKVLE